jgi:integrase
MTLRQLVEAWHAEKVKSKRTADEMRNKALDYLGKLEGRLVDEIEREHIGAVHHHITTEARRRVIRRVGDEKQVVEVGDPGIPATADKWLAIMSSVFGWAVSKGLAATNPCKGIKKAFNAKEAARQTYLHGDSLLRFWKALEADPDTDVRDLLLVALYTGQRKGNVLGMRWDDVDLAAGLWTIPAEQTKQKKSQTNPLSAQARLILQRRHEDAGTQWVFPAVRRGADGELGRMSETRPRDAWERICKAAEIEGVRIHDLRHTAGSWLARLGSNEAVRQKALGHQTPQMAARYSHLELDPVADAMQRMGDAIQAAATKPKATVRRIKPA